MTQGTQETAIGEAEVAKRARMAANDALWAAFQMWFRAEHAGDWSRRNQIPEWRAFQAGFVEGKKR
jgi:hypothetical protein